MANSGIGAKRMACFLRTTFRANILGASHPARKLAGPQRRLESARLPHGNFRHREIHDRAFGMIISPKRWAPRGQHNGKSHGPAC
jgi:hypothetical protein